MTKNNQHTATITVNGRPDTKYKPISGDQLLIMAITNAESKNASVDARIAGNVGISSETLDMYSRAFFAMITHTANSPELAFGIGLSGMLNGIGQAAEDLDPEKIEMAKHIINEVAEKMAPLMAEIQGMTMEQAAEEARKEGKL